MSLNVCPAAIVAAPIEAVWETLQPTRLSEWIDGQVERLEPEGPARIGQTIYITSKALGRKWHATLTITMVDPEKHQLGLHATFPFGIQLDEHLSCTPVDASTCRVQYG